MQSYSSLGCQVSGLVKDCPSSFAVSHRRNDSGGAYRAVPAVVFIWKPSEKQQVVSSRRPSRSRRRSQAFPELSKVSDVKVEGLRFWDRENGKCSRDSYAKACGKIGFLREKSKLSFICPAILSSSLDTKSDEHAEPGGETISHSSDASTSEASDSVVVQDVRPAFVQGGEGKSGFIAFHRSVSEQQEFKESSNDQQEPERNVVTSRSWRSIVWLLGPFVLTTSIFLPPLYLRKVFGKVLNDSLTTDFLILFFTETIFFVGASLFLYIAHQFRSGVGSLAANGQEAAVSLPLGYRVFSILSLGISLFLPVATFSMVWPWTGPAAAAALAPYMVGVIFQLCLEQIVRVKRSPVWPLVPITFQMYRLHQLHRAAQLISGLMFSLKGVEATVETLAISGSLQTLLFVLKILGVVCLGSLGAFLTHQLPAQPPSSSSIASLP
ncbi:hypothetical protein R1sor_023675 [Riccia sorocarpa]|uniref:Uncharacterized protein n=1 Tax=Riccia sorocarpa TaxID=122646 RepID=A0ABD3GU93_9MARC